MPRGHFDRSARKARTRQALLDAAARVYARRGFDGATLDEVAEEAGFTKGAVYAHFGSKQELLLAVMEEYLSREIVEQIALFDRHATTWKRPVAGSDRFMEELAERPDAFRLLVEFWTLAQRDDHLRERFNAGLEALVATFAQFCATSSQDAGVPAPAPVARDVAQVMLGLSFGLGMLRVSEGEEVPGRLLGVTLSVLIRAFEGDEVARRMIAGVRS